MGAQGAIVVVGVFVYFVGGGAVLYFMTHVFDIYEDIFLIIIGTAFWPITLSVLIGTWLAKIAWKRFTRVQRVADALKGK